MRALRGAKDFAVWKPLLFHPLPFRIKGKS